MTRMAFRETLDLLRVPVVLAAVAAELDLRRPTKEETVALVAIQAVVVEVAAGRSEEILWPIQEAVVKVDVAKSE